MLHIMFNSSTSAQEAMESWGSDFHVTLRHEWGCGEHIRQVGSFAPLLSQAAAVFSALDSWDCQQLQLTFVSRSLATLRSTATCCLCKLRTSASLTSSSMLKSTSPPTTPPPPTPNRSISRFPLVAAVMPALGFPISNLSSAVCYGAISASHCRAQMLEMPWSSLVTLPLLAAGVSTRTLDPRASLSALTLVSPLAPSRTQPPLAVPTSTSPPTSRFPSPTTSS